MSLERSPLKRYSKGWFIGHFEPTLLLTKEFEVGIKHYRAGDCEPAHHHKVAIEFTAVVNGRVRMGEEEVGPGEIVKISPGQSMGFLAITDATTVVIKVPSVAGDKYSDCKT